MRHLKISLLGLTFLAMASCNKQPDFAYPPRPQSLPELTDEGRGTFGCRINSKVWLPETSSRWPRLTAKIIAPGVLQIEAQQESEEYGVQSSFYLNLKNFSSQKDVQLSTDAQQSAAYFDWNLNRSYFILAPTELDVVSIRRYDSTENILSGTFNFNLVDSASHDTLKIRDGRFDVQYR